MTRPRCLDLFCGGFGAGWGYHHAGWDVTGVDMVKRSTHPPGVAFIRAKVEDVLTDVGFLGSFQLIHASPPCKENTRLSHVRDAQGGKPIHRDMLVEVREALTASGVPFILENVEGAAMRPDVLLCGHMFGLHTTDSAGDYRPLERHRMFELVGWGNYGMGIQPEHTHAPGRPLGVYGSRGDAIPDGGQVAETLAQARELIGAEWMNWASLTQAIPPAYTAYLGSLAYQELVMGSAVV